MKNKTLGQINIGLLIFATLITTFESEFQPDTVETLYMFAGLGILIFIPWSSIRLIKSDK